MTERIDRLLGADPADDDEQDRGARLQHVLDLLPKRGVDPAHLVLAHHDPQQGSPELAPGCGGARVTAGRQLTAPAIPFADDRADRVGVDRQVAGAALELLRRLTGDGLVRICDGDQLGHV